MLLLQKQQTVDITRYGAFILFLERIYILLYKNGVTQMKNQCSNEIILFARN
jgi:hypothetical protein